MGFQTSGMSATRLVREYGASLEKFTAEVDALVTRLSEAEASMPVARRRQEICTAIWAAMSAAFEASAFSDVERSRLVPLLGEVLVPYWERHCAPDPQLAQFLSDRSRSYLAGGDRKSQVITASSIVRRLLDEIGAATAHKSRLERQLVPLFAHRMLGDIHYFDDLKTRIGIQLSIVATLCAAFGLAEVCEPALRMMRLT